MNTTDAPDPALLASLATLHTDPARVGPPALARRQQRCGDTIRITAAATQSVPEGDAVLVRDGRATRLETWPSGDAVRAGDVLVLAVDATDAARQRFVAWLSAGTLPEGCAVAPCSRADGALHRLWCVAAARIALPTTISVQARHDLLGIRLAQLALAMGADTLAGPLQDNRVLPLAGVPRPTETTADGLAALVRHAGCTPHSDPSPPGEASARRASAAPSSRPSPA
ncbi:MAG: hypothetical protein AAF721_32390 [Myxococcota bacterium]